MVHSRSMWQRTILARSAGALGGAVVGAVGFALASFLFARGIGILGNAPAVSALIGAVYLGVWGGLIGAIIGLANLNTSWSTVVGLSGGLLLAGREILTHGERRYFYDSGYFDKRMFLSDVIVWITLVLGLALVGLAISALQNKVFGVARVGS